MKALPDSYRAYVEGIRAEAESLGQVVTNFLNFARPAQLVLSNVDLRSICERAVEEIRTDARALGGDIEIRGEFALVDGDEVLLRQALSNLLRNAVEACAGSSTVPRIVVQSEVDRQQRLMKVAVNDNGPGIAPALRERIFRPFFSHDGGGTGLGLAIARELASALGGRIELDSAPGHGSRFELVLPAASTD